MAKTDFKSVDEYIAAQPEGSRQVLQRVRGVIRKALPDADEGISYQIPAYKVDGGTVLYFAGWKEHYSLYPATGRLVEAFENELEGYEISKGTIRFPLRDRVPVKLIERIAKFRAQEESARRQAKAGLRPPRARSAASPPGSSRRPRPSSPTTRR